MQIGHLKTILLNNFFDLEVVSLTLLLSPVVSLNAEVVNDLEQRVYHYIKVLFLALGNSLCAAQLPAAGADIDPHPLLLSQCIVTD